MSVFGIRVVCVVLDLWWSPQTHSLVVFSLRQQSPYPVPVHRTGGGVEWDRWAASTNLFTSTAWLIRPVGAQLHPAFGMYPIWFFCLFVFFVRIFIVLCRVTGSAARRHGQHPCTDAADKGSDWLVGWSNGFVRQHREVFGREPSTRLFSLPDKTKKKLVSWLIYNSAPTLCKDIRHGLGKCPGNAVAHIVG